MLASADAGSDLAWGSPGTSRNQTVDDLNGYSKTNFLQGISESAHPAARAAWDYNVAIPSGGATPAHWFQPSKKQWENMRDAQNGNGNYAKRTAMNSTLGLVASGIYWSSTEYSADYAWRLHLYGDTGYYDRRYGYYIARACFAY